MSGKGLEKWEEFQSELNDRHDDLANLLPANVKVERFKSAAVAAAKHNPDLLFADKRSLFNALTKAAQDGLLPDGREAHIAIYSTKVQGKNGGQDTWVKMAQYNPMVYGIRKRAMELGGIIVDAQVVHKADTFKRVQGDAPQIIHEPADLDADRGPMVGVYAIFKKDGVILHREVMNAKEVEDVRAQSKAKDSLMWTKFATEGWRKSVIRRGIKTVPVSEDFERIVRRDDEHFDFSHDNGAAAIAGSQTQAALAPPPAPTDEEDQVNSIGKEQPKETVPAKPARAPRRKNAKAPASDAVIDQPKAEAAKDDEIPAFLRRTADKPADHVGSEMGLPPTDAHEEADQAHNNWRLEQFDKIALCQSDAEIEGLKAGVLPQLKPDEVKAFKNACADRSTELFDAGQK